MATSPTSTPSSFPTLLVPRTTPDTVVRACSHKKRPSTYTQWDYFGEYGVVVDVLKNTTNVPTVNNFIAPSIATGDWTPEMVWDTGFIPQYQDTFYALAVEQ